MREIVDKELHANRIHIYLNFKYWKMLTLYAVFIPPRRKKDEKVRKMMDRLSNEQRSKVASMIQKHSQEMLMLIADRLAPGEVCKCSYFMRFSTIIKIINKHM